MDYRREYINLCQKFVKKRKKIYLSFEKTDEIKKYLKEEKMLVYKKTYKKAENKKVKTFKRSYSTYVF